MYDLSAEKLVKKCMRYLRYIFIWNVKNKGDCLNHFWHPSVSAALFCRCFTSVNVLVALRVYTKEVWGYHEETTKRF